MTVDDRRIDEAAAARAAATVSAFFVPDQAISTVVVAVFDPGTSGYRLFKDAAISEISRPLWMVLDCAFYRAVVSPIIRQNIRLCYLVCISETALL